MFRLITSRAKSFDLEWVGAHQENVGQVATPCAWEVSLQICGPSIQRLIRRDRICCDSGHVSLLEQPTINMRNGMSLMLRILRIHPFVYQSIFVCQAFHAFICRFLDATVRAASSWTPSGAIRQRGEGESATSGVLAAWGAQQF